VDCHEGQARGTGGEHAGEAREPRQREGAAHSTSVTQKKKPSIRHLARSQWKALVGLASTKRKRYHR